MCHEEWGGPDCSKPVFACVYECYNNGFCNNGTCECAAGWEGPDCGSMEQPEMMCEGGAEWIVHAPNFLRTCDNLHDLPDTDEPLRSVAKCACPPAAPIWDSHSRQCVDEEYCYLSECGDMPDPGPHDVSVSVRTKNACAWSDVPSGTCPGCVDAAAPVTICYKAGHFVAQDIATAKEVVLALFREDGQCPNATDAMSLADLANATTPDVEHVNDTSISSDNEAHSIVTTTTVYSAPDFTGLPHISLMGRDRRGAGSFQLTVGCKGVFVPKLSVVMPTLETRSYGECRFAAEDTSCPGHPTCSNHGTCQPDFYNSTCQCQPPYVGADCGRTESGMSISPEANITVEDELVTVVNDNTTYVFHSNGTTEIMKPNGTVVVERELTRDHSCPGNALWENCSPGCFPTCRNPSPRCTPTCLHGSCQCPEDKPVWDDLQAACVIPELCRDQIPCPGVGAICSGKGTCQNGTCACHNGFYGEDCSIPEHQVPRVTTASGTVQRYLPCALPFTFRGKEYSDCTTDYDSDGLEWCSVTSNWEQQWGYCADRGVCPSKNGVQCNGHGLCNNGTCDCEEPFSGHDCGIEYMRYTNVSQQLCSLPFLGPDQREHFSCIPGRPVLEGDQLVGTSEGSGSQSWCLTTFRYTGPDSIGFCEDAGSCGNCSNVGGYCDVTGSGRCICKPGYDGFACDHKMTERDVLIKLYVDTKGGQWNRKSNWVNEGSPCDLPGWTGITCRDGHVVRISLDSTGLAGTIPSDLSTLSKLEVIDLSNNALVGTLPEILASEPISLQSITVSGNMLVGKIPRLPSRIVFSDFTQNYMRPGDEGIISRVTDGSGTVPAFSECVFPFEFYDRNYTSCTKDWTANGKAWCSTTGKYDGKWGSCAPVNTCPGSDGLECSGRGKCEQAAGIDLVSSCNCNEGYSGRGCEFRAKRVTKTTMDGTIEELHSRPCHFPFEYRGNTYSDCTTDSSDGRPWCLTTATWERKWGYCADAGSCPGIKHACSGHGTCEFGTCMCQPGWIWNDCSQREPRVTRSKGQPCHFPFRVNGTEYHDCTTSAAFGAEPFCGLKGGDVIEHKAWDVCAPRGTCPGDTECSGQGYCDSGECICNPGFTGLDCKARMSEYDILVKLFRSTQGQSWINSDKWEQGDKCEWYGVSCNQYNETVALDLSANNLDGTIPADLAQLKDIVSINLSGNFLAGTIPPALVWHPILHELDIGHNQLVGDIPSATKVNVKCDGNCINSEQCALGRCGYPFMA